MKKYYSKFLYIANRLKGYLRSDSYWAKESIPICYAVRDGDINKFNEIFNPANPYINFPNLASEVVFNGSCEVFLAVEKAGIENNLMEEDFYKNVFHGSFHRDNVELIKHLIDTKKFSVLDINEGLFTSAVINGANKTLTYMLYDLNYQVNNDVVNRLKEDYPSVVDIVQKRDLFISLNNVGIKEVPKKNRPKI